MTKEQPTIHVGIDVSKDKLAVAIAGGGVRDEVLSLGTFENAPASVDRLLKKLSGRGAPVSICYEAGPTGYGLYRQVRAFGFECCVVAPSLIPVRAGEAPPPTAIELRLPGGRSLHFDSTMDPAALSFLIRAVEAA